MNNYIEIISNIKVIWFDENIKNEENQNNYKQLKTKFKNVEQCELLDEGFDNFYKNEFNIILVIVSGRLFGRYVKKLQENINKIINIPYTFIFTSHIFKKVLLNQVTDTEHILSYDTKIMVKDGFYNPGGVFDNLEELLNVMKLLINKLESNHNIKPRDKDKTNYEGLLTFEYMTREEDLLAPALYKEIITKEKITKEDCQNFHNYILSFNEKALDNLVKNLDIFKYIPFEILSKYWSRCYSIESEFYKVLNKKLMKSEMSLKYLTFIKMLYKGVEINSLNPYKGQYLYRGSVINKKEIEKIKQYQNKGKLSSIVVFSKAFLSFSEDVSEAKNYLGVSDETKIGILFILENNNKNLRESNANIQNFSVFPNEKEILFFPGTSFIIKRIRETNDNNIEMFLNYNGKFKEKYKNIYNDKNKLNDLIKNNILTKNIAGKKELIFLEYGKYQILKPIASGGFGKVFKAIDTEKDEIVAIKKIDIVNDEDMNEIKNEINIFKISNKIKYSCKFRENFRIGIFSYMVLDYYDSDLGKYLEEYKKKLSANLINKIFNQLNLVFKELINKNICHRDIKPDNILIRYSNEEKTNFDSFLTDYGFSASFNETFRSTICGSPFFIAPEMFNHKYKINCNLFSIGITIYLLYFGKFPYDNFDYFLKNVSNLNLQIDEDKMLEDLIKKLVKENPDERITWEEYFNHPFFKQYKY